jgi:hypothetical protein
MKHYLCCAFFFVCINTICLAQSAAGKWYGIGIVQMEGNYHQYLAELILTQNGKEISGEFNYYFKDTLIENKIKGSYDKKSRVLLIDAFPVMYFRTANTRVGVDCIMSGSFMIRMAKAETVLTGSLTSDSRFQYTTPPINFRFKKNDLADEVIKTNNEETVETKKDSVANEAKKEPPIIDTRTRKLIQEIAITQEEIKIELYDNGAIDYDSVTLYLNNKVLMNKRKLDHKAIRFSFKLDTSLDVNELAMFAENLGMVPPNTAAMIIYDGSKSYKVLMSSDMENTAVIRFRKKRD